VEKQEVEHSEIINRIVESPVVLETEDVKHWRMPTGYS
jgi:hypothetical protein